MKPAKMTRPSRLRSPSAGCLLLPGMKLTSTYQSTRFGNSRQRLKVQRTSETAKSPGSITCCSRTELSLRCLDASHSHRVLHTLHCAVAHDPQLRPLQD